MWKINDSFFLSGKFRWHAHAKLLYINGNWPRMLCTKNCVFFLCFKEKTNRNGYRICINRTYLFCNNIRLMGSMAQSEQFKCFAFIFPEVRLIDDRACLTRCTHFAFNSWLCRSFLPFVFSQFGCLFYFVRYSK